MDNERPEFFMARRRLSRRSLFSGLGAGSIGLAGLALVGCGDDDDDDDDDGNGNGNGGGNTLEQARQRGFINIGIANEPPYGFTTVAGETTGEAPTVAREVLARLDVPEINTSVVPFGSLIGGLDAGRFDIIAAGMFINPERCEQILFSDPDYCVPQAFGVEAGNPLNIMTFEDIAANPDIRVAIPTGAVEEQYALDAGASEDQIVNVDDIAGAGDALSGGRVDAIAATSLAVQAELERIGGDFESTPGFEVEVDGRPVSGCGGYGFRTSDQELRDAFNDVLLEMKEAGEIRPLVEEFGFDDEVDAAEGRTADELCSAE